MTHDGSAALLREFVITRVRAASVHLDVSIPNFVVQEYSKVDEERATAFPGALQRQGGYLPVPEAPGLGVKIDDARLAEIGRPMLDPSSLPLRADGSVAFAV